MRLQFSEMVPREVVEENSSPDEEAPDWRTPLQGASPKVKIMFNNLLNTRTFGGRVPVYLADALCQNAALANMMLHVTEMALQYGDNVIGLNIEMDKDMTRLGYWICIHMEVLAYSYRVVEHSDGSRTRGILLTRESLQPAPVSTPERRLTLRRR